MLHKAFHEPSKAINPQTLERAEALQEFKHGLEQRTSVRSVYALDDVGVIHSIAFAGWLLASLPTR